MSVSAKPTTRALKPKMSLPSVPFRWCLHQVCQRQVCPLCRVSGVCIQCASAKCAHCAVSVAPQAIEPIMSVSMSTKPTTRALEPQMSVPTVPCRWCLIKCTRDNCASAKSLCAKCAVAVVSVSAKPTTRALEPKMSVPTVPLRWCLYQVCKRRMCQYQKCLFQCQQSQPQERLSQK